MLVRPEHNWTAVAAYAWINNTDKNSVGRKIPGVGRQQICPGPDIKGWNGMKKIDDRNARYFAREHGMQLANIGIGKAEIGKQDDHVRNITTITGGNRAASAKGCGWCLLTGNRGRWY